ncbi:hypothetical protein KIN20_009324 [Parelaphostrongylus tenuis]|uniref:Uncharacterized protein n=1 Tax=Parelaphostrongylus tenuis TaxID=148309 RepID=A0AAD5MXM7_PARTN|nr:hypothetical protein KIN20_009324 [Parelaphostrongylus tenuis]
MTRLSNDTFKISMLATISTVFGCGVMPAGQRSTRSFTVSGFTLPVAMVLLYRCRCPSPSFWYCRKPGES